MARWELKECKCPRCRVWHTAPVNLDNFVKRVSMIENGKAVFYPSVECHGCQTMHASPDMRAKFDVIYNRLVAQCGELKNEIKRQKAAKKRK